MKKNLVFNDGMFIYRNVDNEFVVYNKKLKEKQMKLENLYAIKYTSAGPVAKVIISIKDALDDPMAYKEALDKNELFSYNHSKDIIVKWFIDRAEKIDNLTEKEYMAGTPNEDVWREYVQRKSDEMLMAQAEEKK
jgi:hypothetical protein